MWQVIDDTIIQQRLMTLESDITATIGTSGTNALEQCISSGCAQVRGAIAQGGFLLDSRENSIPPQLINCALSIIVYHLASRVLADDTVVQSSRYAEYQQALAELDKVRERKLFVEDPITEEVSSSATSSALCRNSRGFHNRGIDSL